MITLISFFMKQRCKKIINPLFKHLTKFSFSSFSFINQHLATYIFMKNLYLLTLKLNEFDKTHPINSNPLSWNQLYLLSQELQHQVYRSEHYQKVFFIKNLEKICKSSLVYEFLLIHFILNELTIQTQVFSNPTKGLRNLNLLKSKNTIKYWFFYFLNKKNNKLKRFSDLHEEQKSFGNPRSNSQAFLFEKPKKIKSSSKGHLLSQINHRLSDSSKLNKFHPLKRKKIKFVSLISSSKNYLEISKLKSDFLIKKLFYKYYFFWTLEPYCSSKTMFKHRLEHSLNNFNDFFSKAIKKIFLSLYLEPKFAIMLTIYLSRKTIDLWIHKILPKKIKKNTVKKKNFLTYLNIKPIFSKNINKPIYLENFITNCFLLKTQFNMKSPRSSDSSEIQQKLYYVNISTGAKIYKALKLNKILKYSEKLFFKQSHILNLKNFLNMKSLIKTNTLLTSYPSTNYSLTSMKKNQMLCLDLISNKDLFKNSIFKNPLNLLKLNAYFKLSMKNHLKQNFKPSGKIYKRFFLSTSLSFKSIFFFELEMLKKVSQSLHKVNVFSSSKKIIQNLDNHSYLNNEKNLLTRTDLNFYSKFLTILLNLNFLKISKNHFFMNLFIMHLEKIFLNHFFSKLSNHTKNLFNQKLLTQSMNLFFKNFHSNYRNQDFLSLLSHKFLNKYDASFYSYDRFFLRSKNSFVRTFFRYYVLNLFFIEFLSNFNKNYHLQFIKSSFVTTDSFKVSMRQNFSNPQILKRFSHLNLISLDIMLNCNLFHSLFFKYNKLMFQKELKIYQHMMKDSFIFYGENVLIFQKNYALIETHKKSLLHLIYALYLSVKHLKLSHSLFSMNQDIPGFIFYGFSIFQTVKKNKDFINFKQTPPKFTDSLNSPKEFERKIQILNNLRLNILSSKTNIKNHVNQIKYVFFKNQGKDQEELIIKLSPKIHKWSNYYKIVSKRSMFNKLNFLFMQLTWKWCLKRHPNKNAVWIKEKYFYSLNTFNYVFATQKQTEFDFVGQKKMSTLNLSKSLKVFIKPKTF